MDRKEIAQGLRELGLTNGSIVLLHSSFFEPGKSEKRPR